jgi:hypothetical protein
MPRAPRAILALSLLGACGRAVPPPAPTPEPAPAGRAEPAPGAAADTLAHPQPAVAPRARPAAAAVRLAFVGDINLGTATLPDGVPPDSGRALLRAARPYLTGDLVIGNFEGVLADTGTTEKCGAAGQQSAGQRGSGAAGQRTAEPRAPGAPDAPSHTREPDPAAPRPHRPAAPRPPVPPPGCYAFRTPTHLAPRLAEAGFTHLNLANNHANDFGPAGRASTEATLAGLGLTTYGPLGRIVIDSVRRRDSLTVVGVIGFTTYPFAYNLLDIPHSVAVVDSVRPLVDLLVVTFHGGTEGASAVRLGAGPEFLGAEPRGDLRAWAHALADAGADLIVGHGPHVLRGLEFRGRTLIAYSLGNFATYRGFNLTGPLGITGVLQVELLPGRAPLRAQLAPMRQLPLAGPAPDPDRTAVQLVRQLSEADFGPTAARIADDGSITPP